MSKNEVITIDIDKYSEENDHAYITLNKIVTLVPINVISSHGKKWVRMKHNDSETYGLKLKNET